MFDENFFITLEWEVIPNALAEIDHAITKWFWCDGVTTISDSYYTKKSVHDNRYVPLKAYFGEDGQTEYELILYFGPKALSRYARDLSILECIPATNAAEWFAVDIEQLKIEIQLL